MTNVNRALRAILLFLGIDIIRSNGSVTVQPATESAILGEGPHWDNSTQRLYFVDIPGQKVLSLNPVNGNVSKVSISEGPVSFVIPVEDQPGKFVISVGRKFVLLTWDGETNLVDPPLQVLAEVDKNANNTRFNDGKADSSGRFWGGTMAIEVDNKIAENQGAFYRIEEDLVPKLEISPVSISNGLAWNSKDDTFYFIDSVPRQVYAFDYNKSTGDISNKRVVLDLNKTNITGLPDGMTIDSDDNLWIALYNGGGVIQVNPTTGEILRTIKTPADQVTSVTFGGPQLDVLYVTTAKQGLSQAQLKATPNAGSLFAIKGLGARGRLAHGFKMRA